MLLTPLSGANSGHRSLARFRPSHVQTAKERVPSTCTRRPSVPLPLTKFQPHRTNEHLIPLPAGMLNPSSSAPQVMHASCEPDVCVILISDLYPSLTIPQDVGFSDHISYKARKNSFPSTSESMAAKSHSLMTENHVNARDSVRPLEYSNCDEKIKPHVSPPPAQKTWKETFTLYVSHVCRHQLSHELQFGEE